MNTKKTILLTNDDGVSARGIKALYNILKEYYSVYVVAPETEKSGVGHSFTYNQPVIVKKLNDGYAEHLYSVGGSPADCVKLALTQILSIKPDVIISGLNIGENSGISSHYSGTVAGAREGSFWKIKSYAFSLCEDGKTFFDEYVKYVPVLLELFSKSESSLLNFNFPSCNPKNVRGLKVTRQSLAFFNDSYVSTDSNNNKKDCFEFQIEGEKVDIEMHDEYDSRALINNWITVTPLTVDATAYKDIAELKEIEKLFIKGSSHV